MKGQVECSDDPERGIECTLFFLPQKEVDQKNAVRGKDPLSSLHAFCNFQCNLRFRAGFIFSLKTLLLFLSDSLSICLSLHICLYDCLFAVSLSVCLSVSLSVYLSVCLSICCLFMTKPASQGWCPGHSCSCPSVVCQSRDYKRARVAHLLLCNRSRSDHKQFQNYKQPKLKSPSEMKYKLKGPNQRCLPKKKVPKNLPNPTSRPLFSFFTQGKAREDRAHSYPWH